MRIIGTVLLRGKILHTKNLFGSIEDIAGETLDVIEQNSNGHCLCVFEAPDGNRQYLVDVHVQDIRFFNKVRNIDIMDMAREIMKQAGESDETDSGE